MLCNSCSSLLSTCAIFWVSIKTTFTILVYDQSLTAMERKSEFNSSCMQAADRNFSKELAHQIVVL